MIAGRSEVASRSAAVGCYYTGGKQTGEFFVRGAESNIAALGELR